MIPLTAKQKELLDYLRGREICPSFEEMKETLGLKSKSGVHRLISALEERGYIRRSINRARAIELIDDPKLPDSLTQYHVTALAAEAKRRGLVLGHIYRDVDGKRTFRAVREVV